MSDLKVVPLREQTPKPKLGSLEDRLIDVIDDYIIENEDATVAEIVGTLEVIKVQYMT